LFLASTVHPITKDHAHQQICPSRTRLVSGCVILSSASKRLCLLVNSEGFD